MCLPHRFVRMEKYLTKIKGLYFNSDVIHDIDWIYDEAEKIVKEEVVKTKIQYKCAKCKSSDISIESVQSRSCDEPASLLITCRQCGYCKKKNG